jgi:hypothetical protein
MSSLILWATLGFIFSPDYQRIYYLVGYLTVFSSTKCHNVFTPYESVLGGVVIICTNMLYCKVYWVTDIFFFTGHFSS